MRAIVFLILVAGCRKHDPSMDPLTPTPLLELDGGADYYVDDNSTNSFVLNGPSKMFEVPHELILGGGDAPDIRINLKTGEVKHEGMTPNQASLVFWRRVETNFRELVPQCRVVK